MTAPEALFLQTLREIGEMVAVYLFPPGGQLVRIREHTGLEGGDAHHIRHTFKRRMGFVHRIFSGKRTGCLFSEDSLQRRQIVFLRQIPVGEDSPLVRIEAEQKIDVVEVLDPRIRNEISLEEESVQHGIRAHSPVSPVLAEKPGSYQLLSGKTAEPRRTLRRI